MRAERSPLQKPSVHGCAGAQPRVPAGAPHDLALQSRELFVSFYAPGNLQEASLPLSCAFACGSPHPLPPTAALQPRAPPTRAPPPTLSGAGPGISSKRSPTTARPRLFQHPRVSRAQATVRKAPESPSPAGR